MINNDDRNKHEEQDEGEYHFSDEEVNYDVESEAVKEAPSLSKPGLLDRLNSLSRSKRMLLSLLVFLGLVFVVYKMVAPTATVAPSTVITPVTQAVPVKPLETMASTPPTQPITTAPPAPSVPPVIQVAPPGPAQNAQVATQLPAAPNPVPSVSTVPSTLPPPGASTLTGGTVAVQPLTAPSNQTVQLPPPGSSTVVTIPQQAPATGNLPPSQTTITINNPAPQQLAVAPSVTPAISTQTATTAPNGGQYPVAPVTQPPQPVVSPSAELQADVDKAVSQISTEYGERLNTYADQAKDLQDKMQTLNTRVANIENKMNQLIRIMTRQAEEGTTSAATAPPAQVSGQRIPYNVQAIIPGRAWLRSDNGETVTVAEGDSIRNLGRVTKIDPYDGIVEINTGTKTVTLTYGNGG